MNTLVTALSITFGVYVLLALLAPVHWVFDNFANFSVQAIVGLIIFIALLASRRKYIQVFIFVTFLLYFSFPLLGFVYQKVHEDRGHNEPLVVMQANLNHLNSSFGSFARIIAEEKPDVLVLNEANEWWLFNIQNVMQDYYGYAVKELPGSHRGMAVLSHIPMEQDAVHILSDVDSPILELSFSNPQFKLYAVHTLPPVSKDWAYKRNSMIQFLNGLLENQSGNTVLVGDFNSTISSLQFKDMVYTNNLEEARRGYGWNPSWMYGTPFALAIDHVLYKGDVEAYSFETLNDIGSDHRPIMSQLVINQKEYLYYEEY